jgi:hypothetical protein
MYHTFKNIAKKKLLTIPFFNEFGTIFRKSLLSVIYVMTSKIFYNWYLRKNLYNIPYLREVFLIEP